jgi:pimeloyl-ACP methyl ester carboxylesterase
MPLSVEPFSTVRTPALEVAYEQAGPADGEPVVLLHGFPYDPRAYDGVVPELVAAGCRTITPYLRGFGPTRFRSPEAPRSGQQAALGQDLRQLLDALDVPRAVLVGYDWGGRAACIVAALWPERARGLVSVDGYNIQNIAAASRPLDPEQEHRLWYQYYFNTERGRAGLAANRRPLCRLLWRLWSPTWAFDDATFDRTADAFDTPDFVEVVIHSYRHRFGYAAGDPALEEVERRLAAQPAIRVPTVVLQGADDGVTPPSSTAAHAAHFGGPYDYRLVPGAGHNLPQEAPRAVVDAVLHILGRGR